LTGTRILSNRPVQVFGGHQKTFLPNPYAFADHLEEFLLPTSALAHEYIVVPPAGTNEDDPEYKQNKPQVVYIVAVEDNTQFHFDPPQSIKDKILDAGSFNFIELTNEAFRVWTEDKKKFAVVQYTPGYSTNFIYMGNKL